jgi:hypothetical protein
VTAEQYDKSWEALEKAKLEWPPAGLDYHVCLFGPDGNVLVSQVWDTQEQFEAFGERLIPVLAKAGIEFSAPPQKSSRLTTSGSPRTDANRDWYITHQVGVESAPERRQCDELRMMRQRGGEPRVLGGVTAG